MLMMHFLDENFRPEYLEIPAEVHSEEYYVNMMIAWFYATALAKQWDAAVSYIEEKRLNPWTHNKTIQKSTGKLPDHTGAEGIFEDTEGVNGG